MVIIYVLLNITRQTLFIYFLLRAKESNKENLFCF